MSSDLVTCLLPALSRSLAAEFNVFDVMRHGQHEKQLSNVFGWLLEAGGSHRLGDTFVRIFIDEVNRARPTDEPFSSDTPYRVRQEVDTSAAGDGSDIADIVLESDEARLVVENYFTSDGHGHSYAGYLTFGRRDGRTSAVVLLCRDEDKSLLLDGWQNAAVVTYGTLLARLKTETGSDYERKNPEQASFIDQMHRKFVKGRGRMEDGALLAFVVAMCDTGEAGRYGEQKITQAAERFATDMAQQAQERFGEGRELLQRLKERLKVFATAVLAPQLNATRSAWSVHRVVANWAGVYQWSVVLNLTREDAAPSTDYVAVTFGPSAWRRVRQTGQQAGADYTHLFIYVETSCDGNTRERLRQSAVTMLDVLDGLAPDDVRLRDEILELLGGTATPS